jgi:hypothetical protein
MNPSLPALLPHPAGEQPLVEEFSATAETFAGRVHVEWDSCGQVTSLGRLPFFIEYLKQAGLFDGWAADWLQTHLDYCSSPPLSEPWMLDVDSTIKPLYGQQEGAMVGYNPHKPGRPSHCYHTYLMANLRLVLGVDVQPGDGHTPKQGQAVLLRSNVCGLRWNKVAVVCSRCGGLTIPKRVWCGGNASTSP